MIRRFFLGSLIAFFFTVFPSPAQASWYNDVADFMESIECIIDLDFNLDFSSGEKPVFDGPGLKKGARMVRCELDENVSKEKNLPKLIIGWMKFLLSLTAILAVGALVFAGFMYVTAMGDESRTEIAKNVILYTVLGILLILGSYGIVNTLMQARLGADGAGRKVVTTKQSDDSDDGSNSGGNSRSRSRSRSGCFIAGTEIKLLDGTVKKIEDVQVGFDSLRGSSGMGNLVMKRYVIPYKGMVYGLNDKAPFFTPTHPFMTPEGWKSLDPEGTQKESPGLTTTLLEVGDVLMKSNGETEVIQNFSSEYRETTVYNFGLNGSRDFYADGYLTHNVDMISIFFFPVAEAKMARQPSSLRNSEPQ
jgi:hypothetical protein